MTEIGTRQIRHTSGMTAMELGRAVMEASPGSNEFRDNARSLASLAYSANRAVATEASHVVRSEIVQPLADRFCQDACDCLVVFMAEALHAPGSPIASTIADLGYRTPQHLVERYGLLDRGDLEEYVDPDDVEKAVLVTRADLKGDIAVSSPICPAHREPSAMRTSKSSAPGRTACWLGRATEWSAAWCRTTTTARSAIN